MDEVGGRWVPKNLTDEHTRPRMGDSCIWSVTPIKERSVCSKSWERMNTWINHAIPKTKNESMTWGHLLPTPARKFKATPVRNMLKCQCWLCRSLKCTIYNKCALHTSKWEKRSRHQCVCCRIFLNSLKFSEHENLRGSWLSNSV